MGGHWEAAAEHRAPSGKGGSPQQVGGVWADGWCVEVKGQSSNQMTVIPEDFVRRMVGIERLRNIALRSANNNLSHQNSKLARNLCFDKWRPAPKAQNNVELEWAFDQVNKENEALHLEVYELRLELWAERHVRYARALDAVC